MLFLTLLLGVILFLYIYKINRFSYWNKRGVPTAPNIGFIFGHFKSILFREKHIKDVAGEIYNMFQDAPVVGYFRLNTPGLIIRDPEIIKTILIPMFSNFGTNGYWIDKKYDFLAGSNPFFVKNEEWKTVRNHATAALSYTKLKGYLPAIKKVGDEMTMYVKRECAGGKVELDVKELSEMFTTDVLANSVCGVDNNTFVDKNSLFARITREVSFVTSVADNLKDAAVGMWPALNSLFQLRFSTKKSEELLVHVTRKVIQDRMASGVRRNDLFQAMMSFRETDDQGVFTDEYISSQIYTIMLDLHETSSNVILNTLFALAWHPKIQEKLRAEIINFKSKHNNYTVEDMEKFKYLDMVFCESIRMYCPVSVLSRECTNDCTITIPGLSKPLTITRGTPIIVPIYSIHMDPKYYPDPDKFDPERFTDEEVGKRQKYTYLPFGEGPKRCMGIRIGSLEVKMAVMTLVQHFEITPSRMRYPPPTHPGIFLINCPLPGATLFFKPIEK